MDPYLVAFTATMYSSHGADIPTAHQGNPLAPYKNTALIKCSVIVQHALLAVIFIMAVINMCAFIFCVNSWCLSLYIAISGVLCGILCIINAVVAANSRMIRFAQAVEALSCIVISLGFVLNSFFGIQILQLQIISIIVTCIPFALVAVMILMIILRKCL